MYTINKKKRNDIFYMTPITKDEKNALTKAFPNVQIVRTMKQDSKRGHYYCTEEKRVIRFLENYRNRRVVESGIDAR